MRPSIDHLAAVLACSLLPLAAAAQSAQPAESAESAAEGAADVVRCLRAGPFQSSEAHGFNSPSKFRVVGLPEGRQKQVSVAEGYRLLLLASTGKPFVNLKVERSTADLHADDRAVILEQMTALAKASPAGAAALKQSVEGDIETFALNQPSLSAPGPLGFYTLLAPRQSFVVTAYFLPSDKAGNPFADLKTYGASRDGVLEVVKRCMRGT